MADAHTAAVLRFEARGFCDLQQCGIAGGIHIEVRAGKTHLAAECFITQRGGNRRGKKRTVNLFFAETALVKQVIGEIHQPARSAQIDLAGLQTGHGIQVGVVEVARLVGFVGAYNTDRECRVSCRQCFQFFTGDHVLLSANKVEQRDRCPEVLCRHGLQQA